MRLFLPLFLFAMLLYGLIAQLFHGAFQDSVYFFEPDAINNIRDWFSLVHTGNNAYTSWRLDPLLIGLYASFFHITTMPPIGYMLLCCLTQATGTFCLLNLSYGRSRLAHHLLMSIAFPVLLLLCWGNDLILISAFTWFPWLILAVLIALHYPDRKVQGALIVCYFSYRLGLGAAILAPSLTLLAITIAFCLKREHYLSRFMSDTAIQHYLLIIAAMLPSLLVLLYIPLPDMPAYDTLSHVVPDDGVAGNVLPLVGPSPPIPFIFRTLVTDQLLIPALGILVVVGLWILLKGRSPLNTLALVLSLLLAFDVLAPEHLAQLGPLSVLERVLPFQVFFPLNFLVLAALIYLFIVAVPIPLGVSLSVICLIGVAVLEVYPLSFRGMFIPERSNAVTKAFEEAVKTGAYTAEEQMFVAERLASPSHHILNREGLQILDLENYISKGKFKSLRRLETRLQSSDRNDPDELYQMIRRLPHTRWYAGGGSQSGDEWVHLWIERPLLIHGLELSTEEFHTDFPRGIRISYASTCAAEDHDTSSYLPIYEKREWDGPLGFTADRYPYLGSQGIVKLFFEHEIKAQCLFIEQIGESIHYDWSIARLRLLPVNAKERF